MDNTAIAVRSRQGYTVKENEQSLGIFSDEHNKKRERSTWRAKGTAIRVQYGGLSLLGVLQYAHFSTTDPFYLARIM